MNRTTLTKFATTLVLAILIAPLGFAAFAPKAEAQLSTFDPIDFIYDVYSFGQNQLGTLFLSGDFQKEYVLDGIAKAAINLALQSITQSMINWASSGFQGEPSFETDLQRSFLRVGDTVARDFEENLRDGTVVSPFSAGVANAVLGKYYRETGRGAYSRRAEYTLTGACGDSGSIVRICGIAGWLSAWLNPANNPFGSQILAEDELSNRITSAIDTRLQELDWGNGFLAWKTCPDNVEPASDSVSLSEEDKMLGCTTETPGSVVAHTINKVGVDIGLDLQVSADEINEIISGFFTNLINDTLFASDGGLASSRRYNRSDPTPPSSDMVGSFIQALEASRPDIERFRSNWTTILNAARAAEDRLSRCNIGNAEETLRTEVEPVINQAMENIDRAGSALAALTDLANAARAAQGGEGDFQAITADYNTKRQDGTLPGIQDLTYSTEQSTNAPPPAPETLLRKMTNIANSSCTSIFNDTDD